VLVHGMPLTSGVRLSTTCALALVG
jgi:hypothetical protein